MMKTASDVYRLPGWILGWFYVTAVVCTWDATFIMLRPHTMPGGYLFALWQPYTMYTAVDKRYLDLNDGFVFGISLLNYAEVLINIVTIVLHYMNNRHTVPLAFTVTAFTFWKTVFYLLAFTDLGGGAAYRVGNTALQEFLLVVIPNGLWIVLPFLVLLALWEHIVPSPHKAGTSSVLSAKSSASSNASHNTNNRLREHFLHAKHA